MLTGMDYVYAVWQERSFSAAARRLFVSQPALSAAVKKVERELGLPIFDRSRSPLQLTDAGKAYIEAAERIYRIQHDLTRYCSDLAGLQSGSLHLGGTNFFASCFLPPMIEAFSQKYPQIRLSVTESDSADLYDKLSTEELDIIVDSGVYDASLYEIMPFYTDHLLLAVPSRLVVNERREVAAGKMMRADILAGRHLSGDVPVVPLEEFAGEDFLLLGKGNDMYRRAKGLFQSAGVVPNVRLYLNQLMTAFHMARQGLGVTILTDTLVSLAAPTDALVYYQLSGELATRETFLAVKKRGYRTKAMEGFIQSSLGLYQQDSSVAGKSGS
ncbi:MULTISPECIES: LysR family transcriptional regulator [Selenomonas]|uniref:LysR family transcriptional regulator n=1 Tax=Selenomonas ruminis TaxID=2593411 RepID=A0A5D6W1X7_9FIRM|nr:MULTISPECIES: LysR family transcriptional regulator [unclassified Selenomonas]MBQ1868333.1 LysR family transcriptional regulator [Selenomonas sp.]TYZ20768.1 LysR family transcriptional regulator [Selenomonas sp. mPRGC5]